MERNRRFHLNINDLIPKVQINPLNKILLIPKHLEMLPLKD